MHASAASETQRSAIELEWSLASWFHEQGSVAIGFSGGVDSTYLAAVALEALGPENTLAIIGRSASFPESQWKAARDLAAHIGVPVLEIDTDELADPRYATNPTNRCYFCKSELWTKLGPAARARTLAVLIDGTNADDLHDYRPGAVAAREHGVRSPLAEIGMTKSAIRERSRARGLVTWSQPSSPCLASRIPYGTAVTPERLQRIERAESALRALGVGGNLRVRDHGELGRVELDASELQRLIGAGDMSGVARAVTSAGFSRAAVDLAGFRSGSLNVLDGVVPA
jgi:pyridinium-3,5-biscarboxylic acid mononucleotide sulfurtransferase